MYNYFLIQIVILSFTLPQVTVTVTFPAFFAFNTPVLESMVAIFLLDTDHFKLLSVLYFFALIVYLTYKFMRF